VKYPARARKERVVAKRESSILPDASGAGASIVGLLVGGVLYGLLDARVFIFSAAAILAVFILSIRAARNPAVF